MYKLKIIRENLLTLHAEWFIFKLTIRVVSLGILRPGVFWRPPKHHLDRMFEHPAGLISRRIDVSNRDHRHEPGTLLRREGLGGGEGSILKGEFTKRNNVASAAHG